MFVFFGWFALAVFGVSLQILGRVGELYKGYEDLCGLEPAK
jgi:methane/ammonia monooxygenase subunit C